MKKLLSIILVIVTALGMLTLSACAKHEHEYDTTWHTDATSHWHVCTGDDCEEISDKADHVYDNACDATCNVCGATRTPSAHVYDNDCDADCNVCKATRTPAAHVYDHACDTTCNVCNATREIESIKMNEVKNDKGEVIQNSYESNVVSGQITQHVFKTVWWKWGYEGWLLIAQDHAKAWAFVDYEIRAFDENFVELKVFTESDNPDVPTDTMLYVDIVDKDGNDINATYDGKTIYLMFTLKKTGEDFYLYLQ